jgi:hypothetical protein
LTKIQIKFDLSTKKTKYLSNPTALALIAVEILLFFSLKNKRLQRKAGNSSLKKSSVIS